MVATDMRSLYPFSHRSLKSMQPPYFQKKMTSTPGEAILWHTDCRPWLADIESNSVSLILTDPPYFIDKMGNDWNKDKLDISKSKARTIGSLPVGMKFDPNQSKKLRAFLTPVFQDCLRVLKPGGFLVSFSQARLYHSMAIAAEDVGFEIRDMLGWVYEGQAKAFSQDHFLRKNKKLSAEEKSIILASLGGRKTPQLKPMIEPMVFAQKPKEGTFIQNWMKYQVGLVDVEQQWEEKFPGNLMKCLKPRSFEKGAANDHMTVKPQKLLQHIIKLLTIPGAKVIDPFTGSGSTLIAAAITGRIGWGSELEERYAIISSNRLNQIIERKVEILEEEVLESNP